MVRLRPGQYAGEHVTEVKTNTELRYRYSSRGRPGHLVYQNKKFIKSFYSHDEALAFKKKLDEGNTMPK